MSSYVATFHTHLAAMRTHRALCASGANARLAPVPRALSASCGTCVLYESSAPELSCMDADTAAVYEKKSGGSYQILFENE